MLPLFRAVVKFCGTKRLFILDLENLEYSPILLKVKETLE